MNNSEILQRIELIEHMITIGKKSTGRYGWVFILWGLGYLGTAIWMLLGLPWDPWMVTMPLCGILTGFGMWRAKAQQQTLNGTNRGLSGVWSASILAFVPFLILSIILKNPSLGTILIFLAMGIANLASGNILRWWPQRIVGILWWICAIALAGAPKFTSTILICNALVCQIGFGLYLLYLDRKDRSHG